MIVQLQATEKTKPGKYKYTGVDMRKLDTELENVSDKLQIMREMLVAIDDYHRSVEMYGYETIEALGICEEIISLADELESYQDECEEDDV